MTRRKLIAGNWKMNGLSGHEAVLEAVIAGLSPAPACDVMLCPPATLLARFAARAAGTPLAIGAQDCHSAPSGAHTGDLSAQMLADAGASAVILGHSERRANHGEGDLTVRAKVEAAWAAGLSVILCLGETEAERDAGRALAVVEGQLAASLPDGAAAARLAVAYEPVWAIGTGRVPAPDQIAEVHDALRQQLVERLGAAEGSAVRLLYGGSVKPENAAPILALSNVDGALVGGASLEARTLLGIVGAAG